jgi:hypothetical protein
MLDSFRPADRNNIYMGKTYVTRQGGLERE